jgi:tetratricopeptide (TPR) repeat protein
MHRSLQQHLLFYLRIDSTKRDVVFLETLELVSKTFPRQSPWQSPVNEKWDRYEKYIPHVWTLWSHFIHSSPPIVGTVELATVLCDAGNYFWERGLGQNGLLMLRTANQICESLSKESLGSIHADTLTLIACLLVDAGLSQRLEGKSSFERVLGLRTQKFLSTPLEEVSEVDTLLFANGFNDFGCALIHSEMYSEAEGHFLRALNIKKSVGDERSHPVEFAEAYKNLAIVRLAEGNSSVAISLMTQALKLVKSEYDENTAIIQQNRFHLAAILCNSGQYDEALEESLSILRIRVELFGEKGLPTLNSFYALGMMYYLLGKYGLAEYVIFVGCRSIYTNLLQRSAHRKSCLLRHITMAA